MKKILLAIAVSCLASFALSAQNVQLHYDWGHNMYRSDSNVKDRAPLTSTVEMFRPDRWGSTFFFIDMDYGQVTNPLTGADVGGGVRGAYWEISRELKFWEGPLSLHAEYNGGRNDSIFNDAWLGGLTYSLASKDFTRTLSFSAMYKYIPRNDKTPGNFQFTTVWNVWFAHKAFLFCGFLDFWREHRAWQNTDYILLSEPQFWFNFNTLKGWENVNLSFGGEVEISNNFVGKGFYAIPTTAFKWTF